MLLEHEDQACELPELRTVLPMLTVTDSELMRSSSRTAMSRSMSMDNINRKLSAPDTILKKVHKSGKSGSLLHLNFKRTSLPVPSSSNTNSSTSERSVDSITIDPNSGEQSPEVSRDSSKHDANAEGHVFTFEDGSRTGSRRPKLVHNWSLAAQSHLFSKLTRPVFDTCLSCNQLLYVGGFKCKKCTIYSHKGCLKHMVIVCGQRDKALKVFGAPLAQGVERVPQIVRKCVNEIEARGSGFEGVYSDDRVTSKAKKAMRSFENACNLVDLTDTPIPDIAIILKTYLRYLPEPLLPRDTHVHLLKIAGKYPLAITDPIQYHRTVARDFSLIVLNLQINHKLTLVFLIHHLRKVAGNSKYNQMTVEKLSSIFGPIFFHTTDPQGNVYEKIFNQSPHSRVIEMLITHCDDVLGPLYQ
ncbi:Rho GTPase-activating protein 29 [Halotydeus destructor]|nr:Rho GTPase-activating protein 29 [Halotydeus destructor]